MVEDISKEENSEFFEPEQGHGLLDQPVIIPFSMEESRFGAPGPPVPFPADIRRPPPGFIPQGGPGPIPLLELPLPDRPPQQHAMRDPDTAGENYRDDRRDGPGEHSGERNREHFGDRRDQQYNNQEGPPKQEHSMRLPDHGMRPPDHGMRPPDHGMRPPNPAMTPPDHGMRPPAHDMRPPDHAMRPPDHDMRPPDHGMRPPDHDMRPPDHGMRPPDLDMRPPDHDMKPPDHGMRPPPLSFPDQAFVPPPGLFSGAPFTGGDGTLWRPPQDTGPDERHQGGDGAPFMPQIFQHEHGLPPPPIPPHGRGLPRPPWNMRGRPPPHNSPRNDQREEFGGPDGPWQRPGRGEWGENDRPNYQGRRWQGDHRGSRHGPSDRFHPEQQGGDMAPRIPLLGSFPEEGPDDPQQQQGGDSKLPADGKGLLGDSPGNPPPCGPPDSGGFQENPENVSDMPPPPPAPLRMPGMRMLGRPPMFPPGNRPPPPRRFMRGGPRFRGRGQQFHRFRSQRPPM